MADKQLLRNMVDTQINQNDEQSRVEFHTYVQQKMQEILGIGVSTGRDQHDQPTNEE